MIKTSPKTIKTIMATTLISANQYSNSPKRPTCSVLTATRQIETATTHTHCGTRGKPKRKVDRYGRHFRTDRDDLHQRIRGAHGETGPRTEIRLRVNAKGTCDGLNDRHFRQRVRDDHGDERADQIGDDYAGARQSDRYAAAEEQTHADGAADGQHCELPLRELAL